MDSARSANNDADAGVDAILWFIDNPEALEAVQDRLLKAYILHIKRGVEALEKETLPEGTPPSGLMGG